MIIAISFSLSNVRWQKFHLLQVLNPCRIDRKSCNHKLVCNFPLSSQQALYGYIMNLASNKLLLTFMILLWSKWLSHKIFHCSFFFNCFYCEMAFWRFLGTISHSYGIDLLNLMIGLYLRCSLVYERSVKLMKRRFRTFNNPIFLMGFASLKKVSGLPRISEGRLLYGLCF